MVPPSMTTVVSRRAVRSPRQCFVSVAAPRDDLGDHRVVIGRDDVALRNAGVDADTGAQRELQQPHGARRGRKVIVGILRR